VGFLACLIPGVKDTPTPTTQFTSGFVWTEQLNAIFSGSVKKIQVLPGGRAPDNEMIGGPNGVGAGCLYLLSQVCKTSGLVYGTTRRPI
jgi:hypothetical protein